MKTTLFTIALLCLVCTTVFGFVVMRNFSVTDIGSEIRLDWEVVSENGIQEFQIWRKSTSNPNYIKIHTLTPNGNKVYSYSDVNIFRVSQTQGTYTYMLRIMETGHSTDFTQDVAHNPTSIQRTWGSIKSMFK